MYEVSFLFLESDDDEDDISPTLWSSVGARAQWLKSVIECTSISEIGLALHSFIKQARLFGAAAQDPLDDSKAPAKKKTVLSSSKSKGKSKGKANTSNKKGVITKWDYSDAGRLQRRSRAVINYRED